MSSKDLREKRAKLFADAQALVPKDGAWTPEIRTKFDAMVADVDAIKGDIDRAEAWKNSKPRCVPL
jgi:hypothetical protein